MRQIRRKPSLRNRASLGAGRVEWLERRCLLATITVNTTTDTGSNATLSLRQAIEISNGTLTPTGAQVALVVGAVGSSNTIDFNIPQADPGFNPVTGVWTIHPASNLPPINTNSAIIDGYTQPGASKNTLAQADNAVIKIAIDGTGLGAIDGLAINTSFSKVSGLDIENFGFAGIAILTGDVQVAGCFIGTGPTGEVAAPNARGISINGSSNTIGGTTLGDRNVISGNSGAGAGEGIDIEQSLSFPYQANTIELNFIGIDAAGTSALGNSGAGVLDDGSGTTYGDSSSTTGNVIAGNGGGGIKATGSISVQGNDIGTNARGTAALGNGPAGAGIDDTAFPATQAINTLIVGNIVSGNKQDGIVIGGGSQTNSVYTIKNNQVGTDVTGNVALPNTGVGILLEATVETSVEDNQVSANTGAGIELTGFGPTLSASQISGNKIGTDFAGTGNLGNGGAGVVFTNVIAGLIGRTATSLPSLNIIAFNGGDGVDLIGGNENTVGQNSIFSNAGKGISLTNNANNNIPPPTVTFTPTGGGFGTLKATYTGGPPNQNITVELFSNPTVPAPGHEQGKTFVDSIVVTTDGSGNGSTSVNEPDFIYTATGTDSNGTSQFSTPANPGQQATTTTVTSSLNPSTFGQSVTFKAVVAAVGSQVVPTGSVVFTVDGVSTPSIPLQDVGGVIEATFTNSALPVGTYPVSAAYGGSASLAPSGATLPTQTVNKVSTSTLVTSTLNPSTTGQAVTFIANVLGSSLVVFPTGTVVFTIDGQAEPPVPLTLVGETGQAEFTTSTLTAGAHSVSAAYGGNAVFAGSAGTLPTQTVNAPIVTPTLSSVASSANPSTFGQSVTFTASVFAIVPQPTKSVKAALEVSGGTVTFTIDGKAAAVVPISLGAGFGVAEFTTSTLSSGAHSVSAEYSGNAEFGPSSASLPTQTVVAAASSVVLTASPNPSSSGDAVDLTATVTSATGGAVGGSVAFVEGTTILGFAQVGAGGRATLALSSLPVGSSAIAAVYSGDAGHSRAASNKVVQVVEPASTVAPTVLALRRYGFHAQPTILSLAFSAALEAISAQNVNNYHIALLNRFGRPVRGHTIRIREAIYNPSTFSVTLVPAQRLDIHYRYQLTVNGTTSTGVRGISGLLIDGAGTGRPGSDYTAVIDRSTLAGPVPRVSSKPEAASVATKSTSAALDRLALSGELATMASKRRGW